MTPLLARKPAADRQFERIYQRHVADVYRYALAVMRNPADAEDITQTTFLNAYRAFARGERPDTPKNWLIAIAHNVCRQRFRQQQRRPNEVAFFEDAAEAAVVEDDQEFSADDIQRAMGQLAFNQRSALVMRELEGRSYAEIAEIMGLSVSAIETLLFRARRALREQLEGALTCSQAELALSKQTDGVLSRSERGQLRAHLRECEECTSLARRSRASRGALKAMLGGIPLPGSLASFFGGGGGAAVGAGVAAKAAAVVFAGAVIGGTGYAGAKHLDVHLPAGKPTATHTPRPVAGASVTPLGAHAGAGVSATVSKRQRRAHAAAAAASVRRAHAAAAAHRARVRKTHKTHTRTPAEQRSENEVNRARGPARTENEVKHARVHVRSENDVAHARPARPAAPKPHGNAKSAQPTPAHSAASPGAAPAPPHPAATDAHGSARPPRRLPRLRPSR